MSETTYHIKESAKSIFLVEQVEYDAEGEGLTEEHGRMTSTRIMRTFHQPHHVPAHINTIHIAKKNFIDVLVYLE